jgi:hypothetical protein
MVAIYTYYNTQKNLNISITFEWIPRALSLGIKWLGCEADHSHSSSAKVKNGNAMPSLIHMFPLCGA